MIRRPLRLALRPLLLVAALVWVPFAILAAVNLDVYWAFASALAFLWYGVAATLLVLLLALVLKARVAAIVAAAGLLVLVGPRLGHFTSDDPPSANGPRLVVATSNVLVGSADPADLVRLVREHDVDVLAVQEDTPGFTEDLAYEGLGKLLPHAVTSPQPGASGISLYSRFPLRAGVQSTYRRRSTGALIDVPGSTMALQVRSVHPPPPFNATLLPRWKRATRELPSPRTGGVATILAGDFNATLDHHPFGRLMDRGYRDAADEVGQAWRPTWSNGRWATLTIDHILVPSGVAVETVTTHDLPFADHDVVISRLRLPR